MLLITLSVVLIILLELIDRSLLSIFRRVVKKSYIRGLKTYQ